MATQSTFGYQNEEDKDKKQEVPQQAVSAPGSSSAAPGGIGMGQQPKATSGRFTNLQNYLRANRGAGEQIGGRLTSNIGSQQQQLGQKLQQTGAVKTDIGKEQTRAQTEAESVRAAIQSKDNKALGDVYTGQQGTQAKSLQDLKDYQVSEAAKRVMAAQTAEADIAKRAAGILTDAGSNLQNIQNIQQGLQTEAGRANLMRQIFGGGSYSQGQRKLDQALFQASGAALKDAQQKAALAKLAGSKDIGKEETDITKELGSLKDIATTQQTQTKDAILKQLEDFEKQQQSEISGATKKRDEAIADLQKQFEEQSFNKDVAEKLGIGSGTMLFDLINKAGGRAEKDPFSTYVSNLNQGELGKSDVIDENELYRYAALNQLLGKRPEEMQYQKIGEINPYTLEADKFKTDLQKRYEERMADAMKDSVSGYNVQRAASTLSNWGGGSAVGQAGLNIMDALRTTGLNVAAAPITSTLSVYGRTGGEDDRQAVAQAIAQARSQFSDYLNRLGYGNVARVRDEQDKQADLARFLATQVKK